MKRSGNVGLVLLGGVAFAATFAAGMTYFAWQKPSHAAATSAQAAQSCVPQPGSQSCEPARRGFAYYFYPTHSWGWGWGRSSSEPARQQSAAFSGNARTTTAGYTPATSSGTVRSGFGSSGSFRMSAGS